MRAAWSEGRLLDRRVNLVSPVDQGADETEQNHERDNAEPNSPADLILK